MGKSFDSGSKSIGNILGNFERRVVIVPRFQRGFSWEKTQITAFWTDLIGFREEYLRHPTSAAYFFGPIVIQDGANEIRLLDGQQRLATVTILLAAIRDAARNLSFTKGTPGADFARDVQRTLIEKEDAETPYALQLGELDQEYFIKTVQNDPPSTMSIKLRSHQLITSAYKELRTAINASIDGLQPDLALKQLKQFKDCVVKGMTVVMINVESEDDAYSIFETLNDRGLRLSVPDLLLNLLMRRALHENERLLVRQKWNYMLEQMGRRDISRFLRHMWLARYGDLKARGLFNELSDHLRTEKISSDQFTESCAEDCDSYISIIEQNKDLPQAATNDVAGLVRYLGVTSSLPLLLSGIQCLNPPDFAKLTKLLVALCVRYSIISDLNPNTLENAFYSVAREIRGKFLLRESSAKCLNVAISILSKLNPTDGIVEEKAKDVVLDRAPALWLMTQLANSRQSTTKEVSVTQANLEHIFPRNANTTDWPNKRDLEPYLWQLGNLTILGEKLNRSAGNKSFTVKCAEYYKESEVVITREILSYASWTPVEVESRTAQLATLITKVFPGP